MRAVKANLGTPLKERGECPLSFVILEQTGWDSCWGCDTGRASRRGEQARSHPLRVIG